MKKRGSISFLLILGFISILMYENAVLFCSVNPSTSLNENLPLPNAYGFYLAVGTQLFELTPISVTTIIGLPLKGVDLGNSIDGLSGDPVIQIESTSPVIIVYQQNIDVNQWHICDMVFVRSLIAYQLNVDNTDKRFFSNVYAKNYYDTIDVNLWRPKNEIPISIEPIEGKQGMFKYIPRSTLNAGNYAFYFKKDLHKEGMVFTSDSKRKAEAYYFRIKPLGIADESNLPSLSILFEQINKCLINAKNYDIRFSAAPNSLARSKEKSVIVENLDKALDLLQQAHRVATEASDNDALTIIVESMREIHSVRKKYMEDRSAYLKIKSIERKILEYLKNK